MGNINVIQPPVLVGQNFEQASAQLYSYLFRVSEQLNIVLNDLSEDQFTENVRKSLALSGQTTTDKEIRDTYSQLRSLIITTADVIEQEMSVLEVSLEGKYVAQSDFGTYAEETNATLTANADGITQNYNRITSIVSEIEGFENYVEETEAYIKTGLLDGEVSPPIYGVEIGQRNASDEAPNMVRITSTRIGFYQNGSEACYISNGRWGAPGIDVDENIVFNSVWEAGVDANNAFYLRYIGG